MTTTRTTTLAAAAAATAALGLAVGGTMNVTQDVHQSDLVATADYVNLGGFILAQLAILPLLLHLGALTGARTAGRIGAGGLLLLAGTCTASIINGTDPSWFVVTAPPANVLALGAMIAIARAGIRTGELPRGLAIAIPVSWVLALPLSAVGGTLVAAAIWLAVAHHLATRGGAARPALAV